VTVTGTGYTPGQGVYVRFCEQPAGVLGTPAGRATVCNAAVDQWITPIPASGEMSTTIAVSGTIGTSDCTVVTCGIFMRRDHVGGSTDFSSDTFTPVSFAVGQPTISASPADGLNPAGETIIVTGANFAPGIGIYVRLCQAPTGTLGTAAGRPPGSLCHAAIDQWITPIPAPGTFSTTITVPGTFGTTDCLATQCGIFVRRDHLAPTDYSRDAFVPLYFGVALSVGDVVVDEGDGAKPTTAKLTLTLDEPLATDTTVRWSTVDDSAMAGIDFRGVASLTARIRAGRTSVPLAVKILPNETADGDRHLTVTLASPSAGVSVLARSEGSITIRDDEAAAERSISIGDATVVEGSGVRSRTPAYLTLIRGDVSRAATVQVAVPFSTATSGTDFVAFKTRTITFKPGQRTKFVIVQVMGDVSDEIDEIVVVQLTSATGATIYDANGVVTILDDDATVAT
jgi:hypothetical protein